MYDCVVTSCNHHYCRVCVSRLRDCPSCGADITILTSDPETQNLVESFLSAHAGDQSLWQLEGTAAAKESAAKELATLNGKQVKTSSSFDSSESGSSKAALLLQIGLRALSGGNPASAAYRLSQCMDELHVELKNAEKSEGKGSPAVHAVESQMGAVAGCLGDSARGCGDADEAVRQYELAQDYYDKLW